MFSNLLFDGNVEEVEISFDYCTNEDQFNAGFRWTEEDGLSLLWLEVLDYKEIGEDVFFAIQNYAEDYFRQKGYPL